jgi:arginase family enzyme
VPSPLGLRPDGVQSAPGALRTAGLHARLGSPDEAHVDVPPYCDVRDPETGVLNPQGVAAVARGLAAAVDTALDCGRFPIVLGGDCSIVLGPSLALRRRGRYGLVFIDGHADFQHTSDEPNGEVASLDLALVTGRAPRRRCPRRRSDACRRLPAPGGLTWEEAGEILRGLLHASGARGLEVTIFNPRLDPSGSHARHLRDLITNVVPASRTG